MKKRIVIAIITAMTLATITACGSQDTNITSSTQVSNVVEENSDNNTETIDTETNVNYEEILLSDVWYNKKTSGKLFFTEGGTGYFKNHNIAYDIAWKLTDNTITLSFDKGEGMETCEFVLDINRQGIYELGGENYYPYNREADVTENIGSENILEGSMVFFGEYEQDNVEEDGKEPIEWIVFDKKMIPGYVVLLSNEALDGQPYNAEKTEVTWETCSLRKWLNEDFYNTAFSTEEQSHMTPVNLHNPANKKDNQVVENTTLDTVWIMNEYDADNHMDICEEHHGQVFPTEYAEQKVKVSDTFNTTTYWLRSGSKSDRASVAYDNSNFGEIFNFVEKVDGVRPVIVIKDDTKLIVTKHKYVPSKVSKSAPRIGMSSSEVKNSSWGSPDSINKDTYSWGVKEQWVYKDKGYVYLEDGVVTSISER